MSIKSISFNGNNLNIDNLATLDSENIGAPIFKLNENMKMKLHDGSYILFQNKNIVKGDWSKGNDLYCGMCLGDNLNTTTVNENAIGKIEMYYLGTSKNVGAKIQAYRFVSGDTSTCSVRAEFDETGNSRCKCNPPQSSSNNEEIATTAWVRNLLASKGL